jgi:hypothetical protein
MPKLDACAEARSQTGAGAPASGWLGRCHLSVFLFVVGAAAQVACQFNPTGVPGSNPDPPDADPSVPDASASPIDADPEETCGWPFAPKHFDPCALDNPVALTRLVLDQDGIYVYNTDRGLLTNPMGVDILPAPPSTLEQDGDVRALWVNGLDLQNGSTLRVKGTRPLMIVSTDEIRVSGILDVSSTWDPETLTFDPGAGADPPSDECTSTGVQTGGDCTNGGGGGGGAGFGGPGANGGRGAGTGSCDGASGIAGGRGGNAVPAPTTIRGGCKGERGGNGDAVMLYGLGGFGGGAVHLVSQVKVDITGTVHAGGAAGSGAENNRSGGGGGGSGGFIGLEALEIVIGQSARLAANGGGGGGGCNNGLADSGEDGKDLAQAAIGGAGQSFGGNGGNGSAGRSLGGEPGTDSSRGGGGGGGGGGYIIAYQSTPTASSQAVVSPALTQR